ncbi:hypothetical protein BDP27DRAFT_1428551 [Rhodocollybia butyracea]|uniref:CFEM domain-containing protein n=1 Tax=Rhodocollybia butyracea TaxID=206335 RepID=A0A9P5PA75_9AGAR|nr:hypothetical protein BDP27DRAFT_1428551 [Rhodocollybia butyracea]
MKTATICFFLFALVASTGAQVVDDTSSSDSSSSSASSLASATGTATSAAASASATLSTCAMACITQAANSTGCTNATDLQCLCTNAQFQENARECLTKQCPSDVQSALGLQTQQCGALSLTVTGTATTGSFSATGIPTSAANSAARTATSLKAATSSASRASATSTSKPNSAEKVILASGAGAFVFGVVMILGMGVGTLL